MRTRAAALWASTPPGRVLVPESGLGTPGSGGRDGCGCGLTAGGPFPPEACEVCSDCLGAGAGKQAISRTAVHFPLVPAEPWTLSAGSPASPSAGRGSCDPGGKGPRPPPGPGSSPARARGLSQGSARLTTRPETGEKALGVRRPPADTKRNTPVSTRGAHPLLKGPRKP